MLKILTTSVFMCCFYSLTAQEDSIPNLNFNTHEEIRIYKTMIFLNNNKRVIHGILYEVDDSSILISNSLIKEDYLNGRFQLAEINYNNIDHLQIKNTPIIRRSVLIGTITGFVIGAIYWYNQGDGAGGFEYFSAESMAILGGIPLGA